ncbi:MAG: DNA polymerase III subunit delta [Chloroflexota bacterium]|nr:DNA polymerase III subunit delta [Chloroflexota bacterium]
MFLLIGEDPYRTRLRLAELVAAIVAGKPVEPSDLAAVSSPRLGLTLGVTRHDARSDGPDAIAMSGQAQGLFDAPDEKRIVVVDNAEAIADPSFIAAFPPESALVLLTLARMAPSRRRARPKREEPAAADLVGAVEAAGGRVERIARLLPDQVPPWIVARAKLAGVALEPAAVAELASATGPDTDRVEQELAKLATFAAGRAVTANDVRTLVAGAIETEVFDLTRAVVKRDARTAVDRLDRLLDEGQAPQQILALLLWQFRVVLFASAMKTNADAERMARAIRSSAGAIARWQGDARRLSRADVVRAYEALYATDLAIKQGRTEPETALMLCVLDLCGVQNADVRDLVVGEPPRR